jgi:type IX secretion system PorP/SprF family membrane protein
MMSGLILNRYQWDGIKGSPKTLVFNIGAATEIFGIKSGLGVSVISDQLGFFKNISVGLDYAYRKKTRFGDLSIGTSLGFYNMAVKGTWYIPESDFHGTTTDPAIPQAESSQLAFDLGLGVYLGSIDYFFGASVTHLNSASIILGDQARTFLARHYYLSGGYNFSLANPLFELQPAIFVKTDMVSYQADFSVDLVYKKRFSGGLNYRINDAVCALISFEMNNGLKVGYAYDLITSALSGYTGGSHELFLSYSIDFGKSRNKIYKSVRYL